MVLRVTENNLFLTFVKCTLAWPHKWHLELILSQLRWGASTVPGREMCILNAGLWLGDVGKGWNSEKFWAAENEERMTNTQHHTLLILQIPEHHLGIIIPVLLHPDIQHLHDFVIILCECFLWLIKEQSYLRVLWYCISKRNGEELWYVWANNSYW